MANRSKKANATTKEAADINMQSPYFAAPIPQHLAHPFEQVQHEHLMKFQNSSNSNNGTSTIEEDAGRNFLDDFFLVSGHEEDQQLHAVNPPDMLLHHTRLNSMPNGFNSSFAPYQQVHPQQQSIHHQQPQQQHPPDDYLLWTDMSVLDLNSIEAFLTEQQHGSAALGGVAPGAPFVPGPPPYGGYSQHLMNSFPPPQPLPAKQECMLPQTQYFLPATDQQQQMQPYLLNGGGLFVPHQPPPLMHFSSNNASMESEVAALLANDMHSALLLSGPPVPSQPPMPSPAAGFSNGLVVGKKPSSSNAPANNIHINNNNLATFYLNNNRLSKTPPPTTSSPPNPSRSNASVSSTMPTASADGSWKHTQYDHDSSKNGFYQMHSDWAYAMPPPPPSSLQQPSQPVASFSSVRTSSSSRKYHSPHHQAVVVQTREQRLRAALKWNRALQAHLRADLAALESGPVNKSQVEWMRTLNHLVLKFNRRSRRKKASEECQKDPFALVSLVQSALNLRTYSPEEGEHDKQQKPIHNGGEDAGALKAAFERVVWSRRVLSQALSAPLHSTASAESERKRKAPAKLTQAVLVAVQKRLMTEMLVQKNNGAISVEEAAKKVNEVTAEHQILPSLVADRFDIPDRDPEGSAAFWSEVANALFQQQSIPTTTAKSGKSEHLPSDCRTWWHELHLAQPEYPATTANREKKAWTPALLSQLKRLVSTGVKNQNLDWHVIALKLTAAGSISGGVDSGTASHSSTTTATTISSSAIGSFSMQEGFTALQCLQVYSQEVVMARRRWTQAEDAALKRAIRTHGLGNWAEIAEELEGRTGQQCLHRYANTLRTDVKHGKWTDEEDDALKAAVARFRAEHPEAQRLLWTVIRQGVPSRTDVQCRERWTNTLDPDICTSKFTPSEDSILRKLVEEALQESFALEGEEDGVVSSAVIPWSRIAKSLPGRTDAQCQRRWKALTRTFPSQSHPTADAKRGRKPLDSSDNGSANKKVYKKPTHAILENSNINQGHIHQRKRGRPRKTL